MREFTSIFHEASIPMKYNPQDTKVNMNLSVSQKNYPRVKQIMDSENKDDMKKANNSAKKQLEAQKHSIKESSLLDSIKLI